MNRICYCEPGQIYCGVCNICNSPGHISHHPGGIPYTGTWCDLCYQTICFNSMDDQMPSE